MTGKGLRARSFWSVLPPPSRFGWASASAFSGLLALFEFTSTTSIVLCGASHLGGNGIGKPMPMITTRCNAIDARTDTCIEATSPKRSSKKSEKETRASGEGCLNSIGRCYGCRSGLGMNGNCSGFFPRVAGEDVHFPEVDLAEGHAHALPGSGTRKADAAADERHALDAHQLVAKPRRVRGLDALLAQGPHAPVAREHALVL